jgi:hypothetical protein
VRHLALALVALLVSCASLAYAADTYWKVEPNGGAAGGPALYLPRGDILNVRNIQGGVIGDLNLDIGAGSTEHPGSIVLNYDVGRCTVIYDGRKHKLARFCPSGITFYKKPRVRKR